MRRFRRFVRRRPQNVQWSSIAGAFLAAGLTDTTAVTLIGVQNPVNLTSLTSDLPEDLVLLRIQGEFSCSLTSDSVTEWTVALTVQDATWTPGATFVIDADKRILWHRTFNPGSVTAGRVTTEWLPGGIFKSLGAAAALLENGEQDATYIDISPKVVLQPGQNLFLVVYDNLNTEAITIGSTDMRVLYKRRGRR